MTNGNAVLEEAYNRIPVAVRGALEHLQPDQLSARPGGGGNSIAWLIWHLSRVQDNHIAEAAGRTELWLDDGWAARFALDLKETDTGYGHTSEQVDKVRVDSADLLIDYYDAVHSRTLQYVRSLGEADLGQIVDTSWDPPVTLRARLVSVIEDCLQHVGQAAYARGLISG